MYQLTASETLLYLIDNLIISREELREIDSYYSKEAAYGAKAAFTECLEIIQHWEGARWNGLDFNIEENYPL